MSNQPRDINISAEASKKLLQSGNGRAALLYIFILTCGRDDVTHASKSLGWTVEETAAAHAVLVSLGLAAPSPIPPENDTLPEYSSEDILLSASGDPAFSSLIEYTRIRLNKLLTQSDLSRLLGIYDHLGLPASVIMLLESYCVERAHRREGEGARVGMWQIEREAYYWKRSGITTESAAEDYIRRRAAIDGRLMEIFRLLQIKNRAPSKTEEGYLLRWAGYGMTDEVIYAAYDRTVINTGSLKWSYMDSILRRWHEKGIMSVEDIEKLDSPAQKGSPQQPHPSSNAAERLRRRRSEASNN